MRAAVAFLTSIGKAAPPTPAALAWFPIVGASIGLAVGGVWVGAGHIWPAVAVAAVTVAVEAILTGGLHWDGLADTGDGLLPALPTERRLQAMADPNVGAFGVLAVAVVVVLRFAALAAGPARVWVIAALLCLSRTAVAVVTLVVRYARAEGLASAFRDPSRSPAVRTVAISAIGLAISLPLALIDRPAHGAAALGAEVVTIGLLTWLAVRRLGGYTGDVLGAQIVLGETAGMLLWSARW
jgi:adenosylcobinamide-GDP ribazoletransferase